MDQYDMDEEFLAATTDELPEDGPSKDKEKDDWMDDDEDQPEKDDWGEGDYDWSDNNEDD